MSLLDLVMMEIYRNLINGYKAVNQNGAYEYVEMQAPSRN